MNRIIALTLCLAVSPVGATQAHAAEPLSREALVARVDELAAQALEAPGAVGLSVAVARGEDVVVEKGYGMIELEHDVGANGDSVFRIGSITKQFTAAAVMRLIEEGAEHEGKQLTLDAPISDFVEFDTQGKTVTVRHLLTHTSGIKSYTNLGEEWRKTIPLEMTHEQLMELVEDKPFNFEPDAEYRYNNTGYYLLGILIEEVAGQSYADYLGEAFFERLGLTHLRYGSNRDIIPNRAQGYEFESSGRAFNDGLIGMSQPGAAGALISNAGDLVRWSLALSAGRAVTPESYVAMTTPHVLASGEATTYGFGLGVDEMEGRRRISHGGGINGFNSMLSHYPDDQLTVAVISNSQGYRSSVLARDIAMAALGIEEEILDEVPSADEIERVTGTFTLTGTPIELRIFGRDGKVFAEATGQGESGLLFQGSPADGPTEYRASFDRAVRVVFAVGSPAPSLTLYQNGAVIEAPRKDE